MGLTTLEVRNSRTFQAPQFPQLTLAQGEDERTGSGWGSVQESAVLGWNFKNDLNYSLKLSLSFCPSDRTWPYQIDHIAGSSFCHMVFQDINPLLGIWVKMSLSSWFLPLVWGCTEQQLRLGKKWLGFLNSIHFPVLDLPLIYPLTIYWAHAIFQSLCLVLEILELQRWRWRQSSPPPTALSTSATAVVSKLLCITYS